MANRGFGTQTVLGTPQPVFGTTLTAASAQPTPDQFTGNLDPRSQRSQLILAVADPYIFRKGDKVQVGPGSAFLILPSGTPYAQDTGMVSAVNYGGSTITVMGLTQAHASGEFAVLGLQVGIVSIYGNASPLYLAEDYTAGPASKTLFATIGPSGSYGIGISAIGNIHGTAHYWLNGTAADTFLPAVTIV